MRARILVLRRASVVVMGLLLLAPWKEPVRRDSQASPAWITNEEQGRLVERLRTALPPGWTVTPGAVGNVPDEWRSLDTRSFEVQGRSGDHGLRVWFLPTDWIGIRQPDPNRTRMVYWEGVLMDSKYKSITIADQVQLHEAVHAMGMRTPSLVNSGWRSGIALFGDRLSDVDRQAQELVRRFCGTPECADEAAYSLILLGVPARALTLDCAGQAAGRAQEFCASALGSWGGSDSVRVLGTVASNPVTSTRVRRNAAGSLGRIADASSGPALRLALRATSSADQETATAIVDAIGRIRYRPAAPDILARLVSESDRDWQQRYFQALADLRYTPAIPAIETMCETTNISSDWIARHLEDLYSLPELALLRIKGPWGQPSRGIRLLLVGPEKTSLSGGIQIAGLVENVGDSDLDIQGTSGTWIVDGRESPIIEPVGLDGSPTLFVNGVMVRLVNSSSAISTPGTHSVQYRLLGATSNQVTLQVR